MTTETPKPRTLDRIVRDARLQADGPGRRPRDLAAVEALVREAFALGAASRASPEEGRLREVLEAVSEWGCFCSPGSIQCPACVALAALRSPPEPTTTEDEGRDPEDSGRIADRYCNKCRRSYRGPGQHDGCTYYAGIVHHHNAPASSEGERHG